MKIKSFEIRSYRSCIKTSFPLHPELTGLIGINSAGKSNILSALLLRKMCHFRYAQAKEENDSYNKCVVLTELQHDNKTLYMKGEIFFETDERNLDEIHYTKLKWKFHDFTNNKGWLSRPR